MKLPVIRDLATKYSADELKSAAEAYERDRSNPLGAGGGDEGDILSNILMAEVVKRKVEAGLPLSDAIREHTKSIQNIIKGGKNNGGAGIF